MKRFLAIFVGVVFILLAFLVVSKPARAQFDPRSIPGFPGSGGAAVGQGNTGTGGTAAGQGNTGASGASAGGYVDKPAGEALRKARQDDELNAEGYGSRFLDVAVLNRIMCHIIAVEPYCTDDMDLESASLMRQTATGYISDTIAYMYQNPPANLAFWAYDTGKTLGFIRTPVYAQTVDTQFGIGFGGLEGLLPIWKIFRNIAYMLLAVVMVIIGFMIMFRKKIDPKTVVTVQNALPRIVITLILITFSYAIVGLMIDLMYLAILFVTFLMTQSGIVNFDATPLVTMKSFISQLVGGKGLNSLEEVMTTGGLFSVWHLIFPWGFGSLIQLGSDLIGYNWMNVGAGIAGLFLLPIPAVGPAAAVVAEGIAFAPLIIAFLLSIALIFAFIRLLVMFITAYIQIIFSLIIGPIQILTEAIPGSSGFSSWFKNLLSNIMVFPISTVFFLLSMAFAQMANGGQATIWTPPYANLFGGSVKGISALFSIGVLFAIPSVIGGIKESLKAKAPVDAGPGALLGPVGSGAGQVFQLAYQGAFIKSLWTHGPNKPSTAPGRAIEAQTNPTKIIEKVAE